jgi:flagellar protein FlaG
MDNTISTVQANVLKPTEPRLASGRQAVAPSRPASAAPAESGVGNSGEEMRALMDRLAEQLADFVREHGRQLEFQVDDTRGRVVILVKSSDSGEVLRTIPPEEARLINDGLAQEGLLIDRRA